MYSHKNLNLYHKNDIEPGQKLNSPKRFVCVILFWKSNGVDVHSIEHAQRKSDLLHRPHNAHGVIHNRVVYNREHINDQYIFMKVNILVVREPWWNTLRSQSPKTILTIQELTNQELTIQIKTMLIKAIQVEASCDK